MNYQNGISAYFPVAHLTEDRCLLIAVTPKSGLIQAAGLDVHKNALCYEIKKTGPNVKHVKPGLHCIPITFAGDKLSGASEYCIVKEQDIILYWDPTANPQGQTNP
jgi:hypothetical protein